MTATIRHTERDRKLKYSEDDEILLQTTTSVDDGSDQVGGLQWNERTEELICSRYVNCKAVLTESA